MDKMILFIFQAEVEQQAKFALLAFSDLDSALQRDDTDRIWYSVQQFLVSVGNVSKLLWPPEPIIPNRGEELRQSLAITDDSILAPRKFRNHFEHFDERLERWAISSKRKNFVDLCVGPKGMAGEIDIGDCLRYFDRANYAITFRGDTYSLRPIFEALEELHVKALAEKEKYP